MGTLDHISAPVVWLHGAVGSGKSAVSQTLAETCASMDLLLASFFFLKRDLNRNSTDRLAATIAYQVGTAVRGTRKLILESVERNPDIFTEPFAQQIKELVFRPLSRITNHGCPTHYPRLIIVDGLDECLDLEAQSQILTGFSEAVQLIPDYPLRVLVTSCRTPHLEANFNSRLPASLLYPLALDGAHDMGPYFKNRFGDIRANHPKKARIHPKWPSSSAIEELLRRSNGLFAFASMLMGYISSHDTKPPDRLEAYLRVQPSTVDEGSPFAGFYAFYRHITSSINLQDLQMVKMILGIILFIEPDYDSFALFTTLEPSSYRTLSEIECLLALKQGDAAVYLGKLYPIIRWSNDGTIIFPHISFMAFLQDCDCSGSFHLEKTTFLVSLLRHFFQNIANNRGLLPVVSLAQGKTDVLSGDSVQFAYRYLPNIFRKVPLSGELLKDTMKFSISQCFSWCQNNGPRIGIDAEIGLLFPWSYVASFLAILRQMVSAVYL